MMLRRGVELLGGGEPSPAVADRIVLGQAAGVVKVFRLPAVIEADASKLAIQVD